MKTFFIISNRIKAYWENNRLFFFSFVTVSVFIVLAFMIVLISTIPSITERENHSESARSLVVGFEDGDSPELYLRVIEKAQKFGEIECLRFMKSEKIENVGYATEKASTDSELNGSEVIITNIQAASTEEPFVYHGKELQVKEVRKSDEKFATIEMSVDCFFEIFEKPATLTVVFAQKITMANEEKLTGEIRKMLTPRHYVGGFSQKAILGESIELMKDAFILICIALFIIIVTIDYFDSQNRSADILQRLTGTSKASLLITSVLSKFIVMAGICVFAIIAYNLLTLFGVKSVPLFGEIRRITLKDNLIALALLILASAVSIIPNVIKNCILSPFQYSQRRE